MKNIHLYELEHPPAPFKGGFWQLPTYLIPPLKGAGGC